MIEKTEGGSAKAEAPPEEKPQYITLAEANRMSNAAASSHVKRVKEEYEKAFSELRAELAELKASRTTDGEAPAKGKGKTDDATSAELATLRKQVEAQAKAMADKDAATAKAEAERVDMDNRSQILGALTSAGVPGDMAEVAIAYLYTHGKKIARGDTGKLTFKTDDDLAPEVSLAEGIKKFLATPTGMRFLPPRNASGSGTHGAGKPARDGKAAYGDSDLGQMLANRGRPT